MLHNVETVVTRQSSYGVIRCIFLRMDIYLQLKTERYLEKSEIMISPASMLH